MVAWSGVPEERVVPIYHGLSGDFTETGARLSLGAPYVLYVGNRRVHKNLNTLISAFARSRLPREGHLLALSGQADEELMRHAEREGIAPQLRWLGNIAEADLPSVYRGASAVAFVSLYEGFGFPILEGMGCGTPVLTSTTTSMPEVAGGAALTVDPRDVEAISAGLETVTTEEGTRARLRQAGLARVRNFDWDRAATAYWSHLSAAATA